MKKIKVIIDNIPEPQEIEVEEKIDIDRYLDNMYGEENWISYSVLKN